MRRSYEARLYPTPQQAECFEEWLELCRRLYNAGLYQRQIAWKSHGVRIGYYGQDAEIKTIKAGLPEYGAVYSQVIQDVLKRLDRSFQSFFRRVKAGEKAGYPRFKAKERYNSFTYPQAVSHGVKTQGNHLSLGKIPGPIRFKRRGPIRGTIKTTTIRKRCGHWYVVFSCDNVQPPTRAEPKQDAIGVDVGLTHYATLSDGTRIANPRYAKQAQAQLRRAQRCLSRRRKGSNRYEKQRLAVERLHHRVKSQRKNHAFLVARHLTQTYGMVAVEDLDIQEMVGQKRFSYSITDVAWRQFTEALECKAEGAGTRIVYVDPRGTSQECSSCGAIVKKTLSERTHSCACGLTMDRDENAARNILERARRGPSWRDSVGSLVEARSTTPAHTGDSNASVHSCPGCDEGLVSVRVFDGHPVKRCEQCNTR